MNTNSVTSSTNTSQAGNSATSSASSSSADSMDSMFMQLLITQLQNQDPTSPMDPSTFVGQLVQVNSLDQLIQDTDGHEAPLSWVPPARVALEFASRKISAGGLTGGTDALFTCNIGGTPWGFSPARSRITGGQLQCRKFKGGRNMKKPQRQRSS